jgi:hypothetical protein
MLEDDGHRVRIFRLEAVWNLHALGAGLKVDVDRPFLGGESKRLGDGVALRHRAARLGDRGRGGPDRCQHGKQYPGFMSCLNGLG